MLAKHGQNADSALAHAQRRPGRGVAALAGRPAELTLLDPYRTRNRNKGSKGMKTGPTKVHEREHDYTLILDGIADLTAEVEDALFEAVCDDATLSLRCGRAYLT